MPSVVSNSPYIHEGNVKKDITWGASIIKFTDGEDLQTKLNSGKLGGLSNAKTASEITTASNSTVQQELDDIKFNLEHSMGNVADIPTIEDLTYNGNKQIVQINNFNSNAMTKSGDVTVTEPGEYSITFTLNKFWRWSDDTTSTKTVKFNMNKIIPSFTKTPNSLILNTDSPTGTITYSTDSDGVISVTSTDSSVASVDLSDNVATVTGLANGTATIQGSVAASTHYSATSILSTPISVSLVQRIGLLWDGSGFYRVDPHLFVISDSNFNPATTFPYSEISTETVDGISGVTWPVMYTHAEDVSIANDPNTRKRRVWWIDKEPSSDNHVCPSFVEDGVTKEKLWLKATLEEEETTYNDLCTKTRNTVMNFYDYSLMQKLILIEYNTGKEPPNSVTTDTTWRNLQYAWGGIDRDTELIGQWIFGADMLKEGTFGANEGSYDGILRILNPKMDGSFIDTGKMPEDRWIEGYFDIDTTLSGINMGDFMFDTSGNVGSHLKSPSTNQSFYSTHAFFSTLGGLLGFSHDRPDDSHTWRLRKVI